MSTVQVNVEYFFRLLYECIRGACYGSSGSSDISSWLAHLWLLIVGIGYTLSVIGLLIIVYTTMRLFELRRREEKYYRTLIAAPHVEGGTNPRWKHIESLMQGTRASEWREAITEADIMLDDMLMREGYTGSGVGEKLKGAVRANFHTLDEAWEAHKVRNQIAHEGSTFNLSESLAERTIARYEAVFREFDAV